MTIKTKIICTMGPSVEKYEKILALIDAGMNVARLNFSHGTLQDHKHMIAKLKKAREEKGVPLAIMLDTKGPEIRLGRVPGGSLQVDVGTRLLLTREEREQGQGVQMTPKEVFDCLKPGMTLLFDDGYIASRVVDVTKEGAVVEIQNAGVLKNQKGVNLPGVQVPLPAMTEEDIRSLIFGCEEGVDIVAASFIRSADHVLEIKKLLKEQGREDLLLIAKIENTQGVENFERILEVADGIMVARGDLGVELPLHKVPSLQKMMIRKCYEQAKPVITATQMLESMIHHPRPTRAEVSDVANAIYDSTSAVMLSGETAVGLYPIEAVKIMKSIIVEAEEQFPYKEFFYQGSRGGALDVSSSIALATVNTAYSLDTKAIFAFTSGGSTARLISRFRPEIPIFALAPDKECFYRMALLWGVIPVDPYKAHDVKEGFKWVSDFVCKRGFLQKDDAVLITAGEPFGVRGTTNMMIVAKVQ